MGQEAGGVVAHDLGRVGDVREARIGLVRQVRRVDQLVVGGIHRTVVVDRAARVLGVCRRLRTGRAGCQRRGQSRESCSSPNTRFSVPAGRTRATASVVHGGGGCRMPTAGDDGAAGALPHLPSDPERSEPADRAAGVARWLGSHRNADRHSCKGVGGIGVGIEVAVAAERVDDRLCSHPTPHETNTPMQPHNTMSTEASRGQDETIRRPQVCQHSRTAWRSSWAWECQRDGSSSALG